MADTTNTLTDFDMCLALTQMAVNSQLEYAWEAWKLRQSSGEAGMTFDGTLKYYPKVKDEETGEMIDSPEGVEVELAPLSISLNVANAKLGQVEVTLTLTSGKVCYVTPISKAPYYLVKETPVDNWKISFVTDLDKAPVDLELLGKIDQKSQQYTKEVIKKSGLPESVFSIEYLFMNFTKVDLLLLGDRSVKIPDTVPAKAKTVALSTIGSWLQGSMGKFMLGTVVRRNTAQATPTFAMTDFIFHVQGNSKMASASTLSYLGMFSGHKLPANQDAARLAIKDNWVTPEQITGSQGTIAGVFSIGKKSFMDNYLIPMFSKELGLQPSVNGLKWTYNYNKTDKHSKKDIIKRDYEKTQTYTMELTAVPGTNRIDLKGTVKAKALYDGYTLKVNLGVTKAGGDHTEWIHYEGHKNFGGKVSLIAEGIGTAFNLRPDADYKFDDKVTVDNNSVKGFSVVSEAVSSLSKELGITGKTPAEALSSSMKNEVQSLASALDKTLQRIDLNINQHAFIPPGGGVFTFQNARFANSGDLLFDVLYQAPTI